MKIIRIIDNFVSNSSSAGTTILLAVKKGKDFSSLMRSLGIPDSEIEDYIKDLDEIHEYFKDVEYDDLLDEYDLKMGNFTVASWGDEPYAEFDCHSYDVFVSYSPRTDDTSRHQVKGKDLILLYVSDID